MKNLIAFFLTLSFVFLGTTSFVLAQGASGQVKDNALIGVDIVSQAGFGTRVDPQLAETSLNKTIALVIKIALSFVGVILLVVIIYGGFLWLTAGGNDGQVETAKKWIFNGVIGIAIITAAYFITDFVVGSLEKGVLEKV